MPLACGHIEPGWQGTTVRAVCPARDATIYLPHGISPAQLTGRRNVTEDPLLWTVRREPPLCWSVSHRFIISSMTIMRDEAL